MRSYGSRRIIEEEFVSGVIQFFNKDRGFGFINRIGDGSKDYFFHFSEIEGDIELILSAIKNSLLVIFNIGVTPCGRREAINIKIFDSRLYLNNLATCSRDCPCRETSHMLTNPKRSRIYQKSNQSSRRSSETDTDSSLNSWRTSESFPRGVKTLEKKLFTVAGQVY